MAEDPERKDEGRHAGETRPDKPRPRTVKQWQTHVDDAIHQSLARGDFEDLPGKGKPFRWETGADDETWLAQHMLRNAGYLPAWAGDRKAVEAERAELFDRLERFLAWAREARAELPDLPPDQAAARGAEIAREARRREADFRERAVALNRRIDTVNLSAPAGAVHERRIDVDARVAAFRARLAADEG